MGTVTALIPEGLEPLAVWDVRDPDGPWGRRGTADRVNLMIEAINWAEARIDRSVDTFRVEFYLLDAPFAVAYRNMRDEDRRLVWNPETRCPYEEPPVIVPLAELPPAHLLKV